MWPYLLSACLLGALIGLHIRWRNRCARIESELHREKDRTREISQRHAAALEQEHAQEAALFDSMIEGVLLLGRDNRILLVNQALERLFGISPDIRGQSIIEAFRMQQLQDVVNRTAIDGKVLAAELELPGLDPRFLQVNATTFLDREGQAGGMILVFHDVTRIKQLEDTRKEFVANVSHELRTPLSMIKGYVETLVDGALNDPEVAPRFLRTIRKHADRLACLIDDLLTISRLESGQIVMDLQPLLLQPAVARTIEDLEDRARRRNVTITQKIPGALIVKADSSRLHQVLFNLIDNAIKYSGEGGTVKIEAEPTTLDRTQITVADNGPGIPPEATGRIFERFFRIDRARSREQGGTGLGLSIVKHIIHSHGGDVWVESQPGQGAAFRFTLPSESSPPRS